METTLRQSLTVLIACSMLGGCKAPTVNLATSEPIKVDINMRLDVYQYSSPTTKKPAQAPPTAQTPEARRRNRMADIQQFKNERLVGEGHEGLLVIRTKPEGEYGDYVRVAVEEENADRMDLMKSLAESQKDIPPGNSGNAGGTLAQPFLQGRMDRNSGTRRLMEVGAEGRVAGGQS
jgi:hypothetical protein